MLGIVLKDKFTYSGSIQDLKDRLRNNRRNFDIEWESSNEFIAVSESAFGAMRVNDTPGEGIKCYFKFSELEDGLTEIKVRTKVRPELIFSFGFLLFLIYALREEGTEIPIWGICLMLLAPLFFGLILRVQEYDLVSSVKDFLR
ncbi:hypothetical protein [Sediminitomix flava]|uniref:Uncharacterized protein n=1 Tax=Sediminitomix flava TaxID=379075 RepID=A0A315YSG9_SEDFL|nr:hypothetical protein [Sediminitomix flava]PWJ31532.1 hypothetical protein BC781_1242 [Sediminitomix flava]